MSQKVSFRGHTTHIPDDEAADALAELRGECAKLREHICSRIEPSLKVVAIRSEARSRLVSWYQANATRLRYGLLVGMTVVAAMSVITFCRGIGENGRAAHLYSYATLWFTMLSVKVGIYLRMAHETLGCSLFRKPKTAAGK